MSESWLSSKITRFWTYQTTVFSGRSVTGAYDSVCVWSATGACDSLWVLSVAAACESLCGWSVAGACESLWVVCWRCLWESLWVVCYWSMYVDGLLQVLVRVSVGGLLLAYVRGWSVAGVCESLCGWSVTGVCVVCCRCWYKRRTEFIALVNRTQWLSSISLHATLLTTTSGNVMLSDFIAPLSCLNHIRIIFSCITLHSITCSL